ncbi:DUF167 domain-containing protein [Patescibacteria group bacterium]
MLIKVKVIPKSSINKIIEESFGDFKIKIITVPEKGKANDKVIKLLAKYFKVSKTKISIIRGLTTSKKIIKIEGVKS